MTEDVMNSPLYTMAQHFARGGYAEGGAVDETYVNGQLVPGGIKAGMTVAGTHMPRQKDYSQYGKRAVAMQNLDMLAAQRAANNLQRSGAGSSAAAARFVRNFGYAPPPRNSYVPPPTIVVDIPAQAARGSQAAYPTLPAQAQPSPGMPTVEMSYGSGVPLPRNMGWYGQPVAAPEAPQAYAQGGAVNNNSSVMAALAAMGYKPYGG